MQSLIEASAALDDLWAQIPPEAGMAQPSTNPRTTRHWTDHPFAAGDLEVDRGRCAWNRPRLGLSGWSDPFIDAALPMRIAWLPRRHTPSQASSGSWNLVATDGPSFNVAVSQGVVSASPGKAHQADATISGPKADLLGLLLGRVDVANLTIAGDETAARRFATTFPPP